jgi:hypothetical protein
MSEQWEITDHVCRLCFGRLLRRLDSDGKPLIRCADCGTSVKGPVEALCACGAKLRNGRLAGLRCAPNSASTIEQPAQIVVVYAGQEA